MDWIKLILTSAVEAVIIGGLLGVFTLTGYEMNLKEYDKDKAEKRALIAPIVATFVFLLIKNGIF